jgi:KaiC/GvpD/RAD55 family RecA-like ATPase
MREVLQILQQLNPSPLASWLEPASVELPVKGDVADYVAQFGECETDLKRQAVEVALSEAKTDRVSDALGKQIDDVISGKRRAVKWPWPFLTSLSRALIPGTVTLLCGDPGSSKSFFVLEAAAYWHDQNIQTAILELEEDRTYHLNRALAQRSGLSTLFDDDWVAAHGDDVKALFDNQREWLDGFGKCIWEAPNEQMSLDEITDWVRDRVKAGCRVVAIDPVTAAKGTDKPWLDDLKFIIEIKTIIRGTGTSLILVTHPKKGRGKMMGLDELSGGAGYARFSQTVLWLVQHETDEKFEVHSSMGGVAELEANRSLLMLKTRNGIGQKQGIAYKFSGGTLCFNEIGLILNKPKKRGTYGNKSANQD